MMKTGFHASLLETGGIEHAFFGRCAGLNSGVYARPSTACPPENLDRLIIDNRCHIAGEMGVQPAHLIGIHQVHSAKVQTVSQPWKGKAPQADALVSNTSGLALSILTADCAPVLLADPDAGVIGAAHAGWRGALDGILENTVAAMEAVGARPARIKAVIGPCIAQASYEVGPEFLHTFVKTDDHFAQYFHKGNADRWHFDLEGCCAHELAKTGIEHVEKMARDTCAQEELFFSFRRATQRGESDYGRNISAILLQER